MGELINLMELNINYNRVKTLKPLKNLKNLTKLFCAGNLIINLEGIEDLSELEVLDCFKNLLGNTEKILEVLIHLKNLVELELGENPLS